MSESKTEPFVQALCRRTFLRRWTYENPFTDRGITGVNNLGKELCDALIVFDNKIVLLSDKNCQFCDSGRPEVDWRRWRKAAIEKSEAQLIGAERWLRHFPERVFADRFCTKKIKLPNPNEINVFRIVVAHGLRVRGQGYEPCALQCSFLNDELIKIMPDEPFHLHINRPSSRIFHFFDEFSVRFALAELDTVADFIAYLEKKEALINRSNLTYRGEENLISLYFRDINSSGEHDFIFPDVEPAAEGKTVFYAREDEFLFVAQNEAFWRKKNADKISYVIDNIIDYFENLARKDKLVGNVIDDELEFMLRALGATSRLERRVLAESLFWALENTGEHQRRLRSARLQTSGTMLVFSVLGLPRSVDVEEYRRRQYILSECYEYLFLKSDSKIEQVIVLGFEPISCREHGVITFSMSRKGAEFPDEEGLLQIMEKLRIGKSVVETPFLAKEYPDAEH